MRQRREQEDSGAPAVAAAPALPATKPVLAGASSATHPADSTASPVSAKTVNFAQAIADLQTALNDKTTADDVIKDKVATVRAARGRALRDIDDTRKQLREILTPDHEAQLVAQGYME